LNHIMKAQAIANDLPIVRDTVVPTQLVSKCRLHRNPRAGRKNCLINRSNNSTELKKIKKDLEATKHSKHEKPNESELEFKFEGNKTQYKLNRKVLDKISSAMATSNEES